MRRNNTNIWKKGILTAFVALFFGLLFQGSSQAAVGINQQISFQGKLVTSSGANIPDGTYNLQFKIYQDGNSTGGGTLKWTENHLVSASQGITVSAGTFQVNLGSRNPFLSQVDWNQDTLYLSMNVGGTGSSAVWDGEMSPYIRLTSVPYALNAGMIGGLTASQLVQLTPSAQQTGSINVSGNIQSAGTLQANTLDTTASGALTVGSTNTTGITLAKNVTITSGQTLTAGGNTVLSGTGILQSAAFSGTYSNALTLSSTSNSIAGTFTGSVTGSYAGSAIGAQYGGTGQTSYTIGDLLYATGATAIGKLAASTDGLCLRSAGTGTAPLYEDCLTLGTYSTSNTSATGATFANGVLTLQSANGSAPGLVDANSQTFSGAKTFSSTLAVGSTTANTNSVLLTLNNYANTTTEPTIASTFSGGMYYNSYMNQFRCAYNGSWESCGGLGMANTATATCTLTISTLVPCTPPNDYFSGAAPSIPANYCTPGRAIRVKSNGYYTNSAGAARTLAFSVRLGGTVVGATTAALTTATSGTFQWNVDFIMTCNSSTSITGGGTVQLSSSTTAASTGSLTATAATTSGLNNANAQAITLGVTAGTAISGLTVVLTQFIVQAQ